MPGTNEVEYFVLPDATDPYLLARIRWPDIYEAISPARPDWQDDPGLFDLPYDPASTAVTFDEAEAIAEDWGARFPARGETSPMSERPVIRRLPSNWSSLSPAEKRAWSIEPVKRSKRATAKKESVDERAVAAAPDSRPGRRRWRRRGVGPSVEQPDVPQEELTSDLAAATPDPVPGKPSSTLVLAEEPVHTRWTANGAAEREGGPPAFGPDVIDLTDTGEDALASVEDA